MKTSIIHLCIIFCASYIYFRRLFSYSFMRDEDVSQLSSSTLNLAKNGFVTLVYENFNNSFMYYILC